MVVVGCSLDEAYGIPKRRKDKKKKNNKELIINGYDDNNYYSPINEVGKVQIEENLPKYLFIPPEDKEEDKIKEEEKVIKTLDKSEILPPKVLPTPPELIKEEPKIQPYNIDHNDYMNYLIYKRSINEGFSNNNNNIQKMNDGFNDVLLFALFGIFFLIFTDYIYKLGKRSY